MMTTPPRRDSLSRLLWPALALNALALLVVEITPLDLWVQDHFFDFTNRRWIVDSNEPVGRFIFYNGPKIAIFAIAATLLALAFGPARWRDRWQIDRRGLFVAILTLATVPALAGIGKNTTNTFCPSEIRRYGGDVPYVKLCSPYPEDDRPERRGYCFPAGHASGGFALLGLAWIGATRRWRTGALALGLGLGWWMGGYQMLKGAHYLSHTLTTMLVAALIALLWRRLIAPKEAACASA
jgi:membrane-associated PAP2 superfamily phosphatase